MYTIQFKPLDKASKANYIMKIKGINLGFWETAHLPLP